MIFPSTLESYEKYSALAISNADIIFRGTTPPSGAGIDKLVDISKGTVRIFVPAESVDAYKSAYSQFASIIQAIQE